MSSNQINATQMELQRLKAKLQSSKRGHKLLKNKQDEVISHYLRQVKTYEEMRNEVYQNFKRAISKYEIANALSSSLEISLNLLSTKETFEYTFSKKNIMGLETPNIKIEKISKTDETNLIDTSIAFDEAVKLLSNCYKDIIILAQMEKTLNLLEQEIEKGKRRVNAIEYFIIPELEVQIKEIYIKLTDVERSNIIRTMKSKEIALKKDSNHKKNKESN